MTISAERFAAIVATLVPFPTFPAAGPRNPYINYLGHITDQPKFTAWEMSAVKARVAARGPRKPNLTADMPQCAWAGLRNINADGTCVDCGRHHRAPVSVMQQAAE